MFKFAIRAVIVVSFIFVSACSSNTIVKTYEGDELGKDQIAILNAPEYISLVSVNGKRVPKYLLKSIDVNYGIKPGTNVVVFEYGSVWAKAAIGKDDSRSEMVSSGRKEIVFEAKLGEKYTFNFDTVDNLPDARRLADNFTADVIDSTGKVIASSAELGSYQPVVASVPTTTAVQGAALASPVVASSVASVPAQSVPKQNNLPPLEGMKVLWNSASSEEKKAFLKWAFQ